MSRWLIDKLRCWEPENRLLWAVRVLMWSVFLGVINIVAWALGFVSDTVMIAITLALSWLAITANMTDVVVTTDVRTEQEG